MAELSAHSGKRYALKVDLTPMVDLGFLLISFFIFTTTLSEQKVAKFYLPADGPPMLFSESSSLTIIPSDNDEVWYFEGRYEKALANNTVKKTGYAFADGIGNIIRAKQKQLDLDGRKKELKVLVCPSAGCSYKNIIDLMDEMLINQVPSYAISEDLELLKTWKLFAKAKQL